MSVNRFLAPALLLAALLPVTASAQTTQPEPAGEDAAALVGDETTLTVKNQNWLDMRVFMVRNGARVPLGTVTSMTERTFAVPEAALGGGGFGARVVADPIGSRRAWVSETLSFFPGDQMEVTLQNHLGISYLTFRSGQDLQ